MKQSALLEFESSAFSVEPGEDAHTNPGAFGKALASWVAEQLRLRGRRAGQLIAEDFGWCVPVESEPHALYVACASAGEGSHRWRVFAFAEGGLVSWLFGKDARAQSVGSLFETLKQILESASHVKGLREEEAR
jgi:hypothetical protein